MPIAADSIRFDSIHVHPTAIRSHPCEYACDSRKAQSFVLRAVAVNPTFAELLLLSSHIAANAGIGHSGVRALAKTIENKRNLQHLDLSGNQIGDAGAADLAHAMQNNDEMTTLNLANATNLADIFRLADLFWQTCGIFQ